MELKWIHEQPAHWDTNKARIVGNAVTGIFDSRYRMLQPGTTAPGDWWRVEAQGRVVGYGWLDVAWGDAEILLAVEPELQGKGVGAFILDHLEKEAQAQGLNYLTNIVRPTHPDAKRVSAWLEKRGFHSSEDGRLARKVAKKG